MYFHVIRKGGKEKVDKTAAAWRGWTVWVGYIEYNSVCVGFFVLAFFLWLLCESGMIDGWAAAIPFVSSGLVARR